MLNWKLYVNTVMMIWYWQETVCLWTIYVCSYYRIAKVTLFAMAEIKLLYSSWNCTIHVARNHHIHVHLHS